MAETTRVSGAGTHGRIDSRRIQHAAGELFTECLNVFNAFSNLNELSEDLRVLSLNAELAAGRAGDSGRAVRALTQYTRELVNRLNQARESIIKLNSETHRRNAAVLRDLHALRTLERTHRACEREEDCRETEEALNKAHERRRQEMADYVVALTTDLQNLSALNSTVAEVIAQSDSIATNMAVEAALAGSHEAEFRTVAETMRGYVEDLRNMVDSAAVPMKKAEERSRTLINLAGSGTRGQGTSHGEGGGKEEN